MSPDRKTSVRIPAAEPRPRRAFARLRAALAALGAVSAALRTGALARAPAARRAGAALAAAAAAAWAATRRRPDAVLAAALLLGVFLMVLHWKGTPVEADPGRRDAAHQQAVAGP